MLNALFVDWLTASQLHPKGGLPIVTGGVVVQYDAQGLPRFERNCSTGFSGSYETSLRVGCDGYRVSLSGNIGRFSRQDNLFNYGWEGTKEAANRILALLGLPAFTGSVGIEGTENYRRGAVVSRLDCTANYATGNEFQARACIRWLAARSIARMKRGQSGDESVWWSNTRHMLKAYIKHIEMQAHGADKTDEAYIWCKEQGVVRMEIELKKRLLSEMGMNDWESITQAKLEKLYHDQTSLLNTVDRSDEPDLIHSIPHKSRIYASAWLAGQDLKGMASTATLYRHAKVLKEYGMDILQQRNIEHFPVKVRIIEMKPLEVPDWYRRRVA